MLLTIMGCICIHLTMPICWRGSYKQDLCDRNGNRKQSALLRFVMLSIIKVRVEFVGTPLLGWQVLRIKLYNESNFFSSEEKVGKLISRYNKFIFSVALLDLIYSYWEETLLLVKWYIFSLKLLNALHCRSWKWRLVCLFALSVVAVFVAFNELRLRSFNQQIAMCLKIPLVAQIPIRLTALMGIVSSTQMAHLFYVLFVLELVDANQR